MAFATAWGVLVAWAVVSFTALEQVWPRRPGRPGWRRIALAAALLAIDAAIARLVIRDDPAPRPVLRIVIAWLIMETLMYGVHRAMHRVAWLWRFHRLHHADLPLSWATAWISHPFDAALFASCAALGGWLAGASPAGAVGFVVARRAWTLLLHANVAWPASALDQVIATPAFHDRHHCEHLPPANFASSLPVLDLVFGSYRGSDRISARSSDRGIDRAPAQPTL
ncbi:MAG TPA: sterol desaturase family protein [Kofleriaceae bacterium]